MKNTIFLVVTACLLTGCSSKEPTTMKIKTEAEVTSKDGLLVKVMPQSEKPLPIAIAPNKTSVVAFVAFLIAVVATAFAAIAACWAAYNTKKVLEKIRKRSDE
jgi:uncharacterized lipoprotein YajG